MERAFVSDTLVPVLKSEITVGQPLRWAVYDGNGVLLLNRGVVVANEHQLERLLENGLFFRERDRGGASRSDRLDSKEDGGGGGGRAAEVTLPFDQVKLLPGDAMQMQPLAEGQNERYTVRIIGIMKGRSVLVTAPVVEGKLVFLRDGQTFLIRVFSGLNVCAFKAKVLKSQLVPFPYLHLSYPDEVQAMLIRKALRAPADIIVAVHEGEGGRQTAAGRMVDLSVGGARILSKQSLGEKGAQLYLSFKVRLDDMEEYVKTPAVIRSLGQEDDEQGRPQVATGVQFGELNQAQRLIIMNLVYQHLLKDTP